jgi:hypothetical protein
LSPAFSFTPTEIGTPEQDQPGLESLGRHQAGLEVKHEGNFDKEVYFPPEPEDKAPEAVVQEKSESEEESHKPVKRTCGLRRTTFFIALFAILIVVIGVGLGVGLGIGLKQYVTVDVTSRIRV